VLPVTWMARVLKMLVEAPRACSYLPGRVASHEHRVMLETSAVELEALLVRGWRRFGPDYFRPACSPCHECVPTRIAVREHVPSRSERRALRGARGLRLVVGRPRVDDERVELHQRWHAFREREKSWSPSDLDARSYALSFAFPHDAGRELAYYDDAAPNGPRLVGVGLSDETPHAWSAAYFFYDPDYARRSLGVVHAMVQIQLARQRNIPHLYLGFWIRECPSMSYKARFHPRECLVGRPTDDEEPSWQRSD
jgi:leucyl-tRNA---protein transferase